MFDPLIRHASVAPAINLILFRDYNRMIGRHGEGERLNWCLERGYCVVEVRTKELSATEDVEGTMQLTGNNVFRDDPRHLVGRLNLEGRRSAVVAGPVENPRNYT